MQKRFQIGSINITGPTQQQEIKVLYQAEKEARRCVTLIIFAVIVSILALPFIRFI